MWALGTLAALLVGLAGGAWLAVVVLDRSGLLLRQPPGDGWEQVAPLVATDEPAPAPAPGPGAAWAPDAARWQPSPGRRWRDPTGPGMCRRDAGVERDADVEQWAEARQRITPDHGYSPARPGNASYPRRTDV